MPHVLILIALAASLVAETDAGDLRTRYARSFACEAQGDLAGARTAIAPLLQSQRGDYLLNLRLGWLNYRLGQHAVAIDHYRSACTAAPKAVEPRLGLMLPLMAQRAWTEVETQARLVLRLDPANATACRWLTEALLAQDHPREAIGVAEPLCERYPTDPQVVELTARAQLAAGSVTAARSGYQMLLILDPGNRAAMQALAAR